MYTDGEECMFGTYQDLHVENLVKQVVGHANTIGVYIDDKGEELSRLTKHCKLIVSSSFKIPLFLIKKTAPKPHVALVMK